MKILIAHNAYQHIGGEDAVVQAEIALLRNYGHQVQVYQRHNDDVRRMSAAATALAALWSRQSVREAARICEQFQPDVIHAHNTFPLISPALYWMAAKRKLPLVQTLHNFRLLCPQAMFLRDGKICEDCLGKLPWRAIVHKCYHQSVLQSAVVGGMLATHRALGSYQNKVTRFIVLNSFCRSKFIAAGLPADRLRIKPNFVAVGAAPISQHRHGGLFVGRMSSEKGLDILIAASAMAKLADFQLIGDGPFAATAKAAFGPRYLGYLTLDEILLKMRHAAYLVLPSICYESAPRTIVEAFACGLPVIASRLGSMADLVQDGVTGLLFDPGNAYDLAAKIGWAETHPNEMLAMGQAAYVDYRHKYTPERNHQILLDIYQDAINATHKIGLGECRVE